MVKWATVRLSGEAPSPALQHWLGHHGRAVEEFFERPGVRADSPWPERSGLRAAIIEVARGRLAGLVLGTRADASPEVWEAIHRNVAVHGFAVEVAAGLLHVQRELEQDEAAAQRARSASARGW